MVARVEEMVGKIKEATFYVEVGTPLMPDGIKLGASVYNGQDLVRAYMKLTRIAERIKELNSTKTKTKTKTIK